VGEWSGVNATTYQAFSMRMAEVKKPLGPGGPGAGRSTRAEMTRRRRWLQAPGGTANSNCRGPARCGPKEVSTEDESPGAKRPIRQRERILLRVESYSQVCSAAGSFPGAADTDLIASSAGTNAEILELQPEPLRGARTACPQAGQDGARAVVSRGNSDQTVVEDTHWEVVLNLLLVHVEV